jgi:hypothetical protein
LLLFLLLGIYLPVSGQGVADTSFRQKAIENLIGFYRTSIGLQAHLYNGPLYEPYIRSFISGHQFFNIDSITKGSVTYDGLGYYNISMRYDLVRDEVIIQHPNGFAINLIKQKLDSFSLFDQQFVKIENVKGAGGLDSTGYYQQLYSSPAISLLAKRKKFLQEVIGRTSIETSIYSRDFYYIVKDGNYYPIKNKKALLEILKDKKSETQQYIKRNRLRFREFEKDVLETVSYYDQLN